MNPDEKETLNRLYLSHLAKILKFSHLSENSKSGGTFLSKARLNLFTILYNFNRQESQSKGENSNSFTFYEKILYDRLSAIILSNKLIFCQIHQSKVFIFSQNFNLTKVSELKELKQISLSGNFAMILKFFPDPLKDVNRILLIKAFSTKQREDIVQNILPDGNWDNKIRTHFKKQTLFQILKERHIFLNDMICENISNLRESGMLFNNDVYDLLTAGVKISSDEFLKFKIIIFLFSNSGIVEYIFQTLFYNINGVKFEDIDLEEMCTFALNKLRKHRDSISFGKIAKRSKANNKKKHNETISRQSITYPNNNISFFDRVLEGNKESRKSNNSDESLLKSRPRHNEKHSKTNYVKHKQIIKGPEDNVLTKPLYDKIVFNVVILKYFGKEQKVLEINNSGVFLIYKKGKSDNFLSYMIDDIVQMEGENNTNALNITTVVKEVKKITYLEFSNAYEKYVFKTIIYNHLLLSMPRYKMGDQLILNVNVMTWSLAGIDVPSDLVVMFNTQAFEGIDIFTIGVQECSIFKIKDWQKHLKTLISYYGYEDVASIDMCQMFLIVFIKKDLRPFVENVCSSYKPMGFAKIIGNKGGIIVTFRLMGYQLTFVNCHLAPKPYKVLERNKHAKNLVKSIRIGEKFADFDILSDYLFWQGDLNYRIDYNFDETVREIKKNNIKLLLAKDQLLRQKQQNQIFYDFQEPEINFFPTYRRIKGTDEYSNKNNQSPSWCDRIMVKTTRDLDMLYYDSIKNVKHSDHMPVLAKFSIYLTIPSFDDIEKTLNQNVAGQFIYSNLCLNYDFTEAFSELDIEPKFPFKLKLSSHYFLNKNNSDTKYTEIKDFNQLENIYFDPMVLNFPPQFIFDLPHSRALNIFFILTLTMGKASYEIGFAKYSLENVEKDNLHLLIHEQKLEITWRLRKFGTLSFSSNYKF